MKEWFLVGVANGDVTDENTSALWWVTTDSVRGALWFDGANRWEVSTHHADKGYRPFVCRVMLPIHLVAHVADLYDMLDDVSVLDVVRVNVGGLL